MTDAERVHAVVDYGFTDRQARFLVLVMRHAGLCVKRQYAAFAGIANGGEKCNAFFDKLVRRGFVATADCIHNRARLYHVQHRALYHAIGDTDSRYRRAVPARSAAERLMRLDAALTAPDLDWLVGTWPELTEGQRAEIQQFADRLVNKMLHPPLESLRDAAESGPPHSLLDALRRLFRLED